MYLIGSFLQHICITCTRDPPLSSSSPKKVSHGLRSRCVVVSLLIFICAQYMESSFSTILSFDYPYLIKLGFHNIISQLHDGLIPKEKFMIEKTWIIYNCFSKSPHYTTWSLTINGESHNPRIIMLSWNLVPWNTLRSFVMLYYIHMYSMVLYI